MARRFGLAGCVFRLSIFFGGTWIFGEEGLTALVSRQKVTAIMSCDLMSYIEARRIAPFGIA
jgi:hypothetical protein